VKYIVLFFASFTSCNLHSIKDEKKTYQHIDSAMKLSKSLHDSALRIHKLVDEKTKKEVEKVTSIVCKLKLENVQLKENVKNLNEKSRLVQTITIHDTIFITEKKNFWGKTKTSIDTSSSTQLDSVNIIEN
jgi:hypothetical protein